MCVFGYFAVGFWICNQPSGALTDGETQPSAGWWLIGGIHFR